jgi:predicted lipoprotein with Yx(FWY)xxD motif
MKRRRYEPPRTIIGAGVVVVALGAAGIAATVGMHGSATTGASFKAVNAAVTPAVKSTPSAATPAMKNTASATSPTIHTANATVDGKTEAILVNAKGLPLYIYKLDTATKSFVSGHLAAYWPPLDSSSPTVVGATGKLSVTREANGAQVAYKGHFLYTFLSDTAGHVTGQGVSDFFVATPGIAPIGASSPVLAAAPTTSSSGMGY